VAYLHRAAPRTQVARFDRIVPSPTAGAQSNRKSLHASTIDFRARAMTVH
jgi:hypothetical protein